PVRIRHEDDLRLLVAVEVRDDRRHQRAGAVPLALELGGDELADGEPLRLAARVERAARPAAPRHADAAHAGARVAAAPLGAVAVGVVLALRVRAAGAVV